MKLTGVACALAFLVGGYGAETADANSPEFNLRVMVSPEARRHLAAAGEGVTVAADLYGDPSAEGRKHADEMGRVLVLRRQFSLPAEGGTITIKRDAIASDRRRWLAGPMKINVNVYSSRKSNPDNVLACDFMDGPLPETRQPVVFNCSLLTEGKQSKRVT